MDSEKTEENHSKPNTYRIDSRVCAPVEYGGSLYASLVHLDLSSDDVDPSCDLVRRCFIVSRALDSTEEDEITLPLFLSSYPSLSVDVLDTSKGVFIFLREDVVSR